MRRALPFAAVGIPFLALAAITAGSGQVLEVNHFDTAAQVSYINAAACAETTGQTLLSLEWSIKTTDGSSPTTGTYKIFSSNTAPDTSTTAGTNQFFCPEADDPNKSPPIKANQVGGTINTTSSLQSASVSARTAVTSAGFTCDASSEGKELWVCAHWFKATTNDRAGYASGKFQVQVTAPEAPTGVRADPRDSKLDVSWTASSGATKVDHYVVEVSTGGTLVSSVTANGTSATVGGLVNGTEYTIVVFAYSLGGNRSTGSTPPATGTPVPSADFSQVYDDAGGVERGGCSSGSAGLLALAAATSLLVARRRKR